MARSPYEDAPEQSASSPSATLLVALVLLSAATLLFEINLSRLFSVAQFYHFAFMVVSIALLGFGASGSALAVFPRLRMKNPHSSLSTLALLTGFSLLGSYLLTNWMPFDSFRVAWERKQVAILTLHYLALASPFFFSGMAVGLLLGMFSGSVGRVYAANLVGSAMGCLLALLSPSFLGGEGNVVLSSALATLAALTAAKGSPDGLAAQCGVLRCKSLQNLPLVLAGCLLLFSLADLGGRLFLGKGFPFLALRLSPYKSLSYALQHPGAQVVFQKWNAYSRVDVVRGASVHSIPGLSYRFLRPIPPQAAIAIDGDDLSPIFASNVDTDFAAYVPLALAFQLRPGAKTLVLGPRGGLDVIAALALGAREIVAVEMNPLVVEAVGFPYTDSRVQVVIEDERSYLRRGGQQFDVVVLSLTSAYRPIRSGAYSLIEDYRFTVEAFEDILALLNEGALFAVTRWLQDPPSEDLRTFALAITALEKRGGKGEDQIVAFRGYNTLTILVKNGAFLPAELQLLRRFAAERAFDLVYTADIRVEETNRFNVLPRSIYYETFLTLLKSTPRRDFYASYPYHIEPPTDDRPFFGHYFKWAQAGQVWAELGRTWQPFGGAGYFVILALLALATFLAGVLILLPLAWIPATPLNRGSLPLGPILLYFAALGFGFLLVEIPLIQRFIVYLGQPAYAMTVVLFTLLLFSGIGSRLAERLPLGPMLGILTLGLGFLPLGLTKFFAITLDLPFHLRLGLAILVLAPFGFLMGIPFPGGLRWLASTYSREVSTEQGKLHHSGSVLGWVISWVWGVNGAFSVVASILAALMALSFGFRVVFWGGALSYALAWIVLTVVRWRVRAQYPHR